MMLFYQNQKLTIKWTLNSTFEERGKLAVYSEKETSWLSIQRKRQIGCQCKERVDQPPVIIHPTSFSQKKKIKGEDVEGTSFSFFERERLGEYSLEVD